MLNKFSMSLLHYWVSNFLICFLTLAEKRATIAVFAVCVLKIYSSLAVLDDLFIYKKCPKKWYHNYESSSRRNKRYECTVNKCNGLCICVGILTQQTNGYSSGDSLKPLSLQSHGRPSNSFTHLPTWKGRPHMPFTPQQNTTRIQLHCSQIPPLHKYSPHIPLQTNVIQPPLS